jgi:hypothetical protein
MEQRVMPNYALDVCINWVAEVKQNRCSFVRVQ